MEQPRPELIPNPAVRRLSLYLRQLEASLAVESTERRPFIQAFVRPFGLDVPATPRFADEVEAMAGEAAVPARRARFARPARFLLRKAIAYRDDVTRERWLYSERELEKIARMRAMRESKIAIERERKNAERALKQRKQAERQIRREQRRADQHGHPVAPGREGRAPLYALDGQRPGRERRRLLHRARARVGRAAGRDLQRPGARGPLLSTPAALASGRGSR